MTKYKDLEGTIWIPLLSICYKQRKPIPQGLTQEIAQYRSNIINYLHHIVYARKRDKMRKLLKGCDLFIMQAVYTCCRWEEIGSTWYENNPIITREPIELYKIIAATSYSGKLMTPKNEVIQQPKLLIGMPIYAIDKHTYKGRNKNRGYRYFFEEGCKLNKVKPEDRDRQIMYYRKVVETMIRDGFLPENFMDIAPLEYLFPIQ
jgi:hypothetical protein